jgi:hypothetical protein
MTSGAAGCGDLELVCPFLSVHQRWASASLPDTPTPRHISRCARYPFVQSKRLGARQSMSSLLTFQ